MTKKRKMNQLAICIFIGICMIQSIYYPYLSAPEQGLLKWWNIGPLAGFGFIIGFPVLWLAETISFPEYKQQVYWALTPLYLSIIYLLMSFPFRKGKKHG